MTYAKKTDVSVNRSRQELEQTVTRYGASKFFTGWDEDAAVLGFEMSDRFVEFRLPLPVQSDYRTVTQFEQAQRSAWRALLLVIKAKLEAVESGIETFEESFLSHIMVRDEHGDNTTIGKIMIPQIETSYQGGKPMLALPSGRG